MTISKNQLQRLYVEQELSKKETAKRLGYKSAAPVGRALEENNIPTRTSGGKPRDAPWKDEEKLREMYHGQEMTTPEIAEQFDCTDTTIQNQLEENGIEKRNPGARRKESISLVESKKGYESWKHRGGTVFVHRLAAIAWFGLDSVMNQVCHHKNGIRWDNREDNIELMSRADHTKEHWERGDL